MLCPKEGCGQKYKVKSTLAGQKVKCSLCGERFVIGGKPRPRDEALEPITVPLKPSESPQGLRQAQKETEGQPEQKRTSKKEVVAKAPARPRPATMAEGKSTATPKATRFVFPAVAILVSSGVVWSAFKSIGESKAHAAAVQTSGAYKKKQALAESFQKQAEEPAPSETDSEAQVAVTHISLATIKSVQAEIQREGAEPFLVRKGQPVVVWGDAGSERRVEVFLPEQRVSGQIDSVHIEETTPGKVSVKDLLGFVNSPVDRTAAINSLTFRADGGLVTVIGNGSYGRVLEVPSGQVIRNFESSAQSAAFLPDGSLLIGTKLGGKVWDGHTTATLARLKESKGPLLPLPQGTQALEYSSNGLTLWDLEQARSLASNGKSPSALVRISKDGAHCASVSSSGEVTLFSLPELKTEKSRAFHISPADFDYSFDTHTVAIAAKGQTFVTLGNVSAEDSSRELNVHRQATSVRFFSYGRYLAVTTKDSKVVQVIDLRENRQALLGVPANSPISAIEFSPDGSTAALGHSNGQVSFLSMDKEELSAAFARYDQNFIEPVRRKEKALYTRFRNALLNSQREQAESCVAELKARFPNGEYAAKAEAELNQQPTATVGTETGSKTNPPATIKMPDNPRTVYNFFYGFLLNKKTKQAMQYYDHLLKNHPDSEFAEKAKEQLENYKIENK